MATFLSDTFTEASTVVLSSHTPEIGGAWIEHGSYPDNLSIDADSDAIVGSIGVDVGVYYNDADPASADYSVTVDIFVVNNAVASYPGVVGRVATAANTMYRALYDQAEGRWELEKVVAGIITALDVPYSQALANSQTYALKLEMIGTTIKAYIDGVERMIDTDTAISAAGKAGVLQYSSSGQQVTSISAEDIGGAAEGFLLVAN